MDNNSKEGVVKSNKVMNDRVFESERVFEHENQSVTNSKIVAELFGKNHENVIRKIKDLLLQYPELEWEYFIPEYEVVKQPNGKNKHLSYYLISNEGFCYLTVSYANEKISKAFFELNQEFDNENKFICANPEHTIGKALLTAAKRIRLIDLSANKP